MNITAQFFIQSLNDSTRMRCLQLLLSEGEMCVCELTYALDVIQPKISRHLAILKDNGIVIDRRNGQWIYYKLAPTLPGWAKKLLQAACEGYAEEAQYKKDKKRLAGMTDRPANRNCA